jgi:hypothetical protein
VERAKYSLSFVERALTVVVAWLVRALGATLRFSVEGEEVFEETLAAGSSLIFFGWHEFFLVACCDLAHYRPHIMISQSRDGERVTHVAERLGWRVVRGSSSRGGARALLEMVRTLREPTLAGHLVDGPRGPRHEVKPGIVAMAQRSRAVLVPMTYYVPRKWRARSWDRLQVPLPFQRIVGRVLPARCIPENLDDAGIAALCADFKTELDGAYAELESAHTGQPAPEKRRS